MKAITLWQPWASLIAEGFKTIETRSHPRFSSLKGQRIIIHAGRKFDDEAARVVQRYSEAAYQQCRGICYGDALQGCILCMALVEDARWLTSDDEVAALCPTAGRFGLVLTKIIQVVPKQARGHQGIWKWNGDRVT